MMLWIFSTDHAVERCFLSVCLSVCTSVTRQYSVKTAKHIIILFHCQVATPFWFFHTKWYGNILTGTPLIGAFHAGGVKIAIFNHYLTLSRK